MSAFKSNKEALDALQRAINIVLFTEQAVRATQAEEPFCAAAMSDTISIAYDLMIDVISHFDDVLDNPRLQSEPEAENA